MGVTPSVGQLGPDADKASRFEPGPESEHALATGAAPALKPGVDDHSVRRFDGTAADGRAGIAGLPITHPLAVAADRPNDGGDLAGPGTLQHFILVSVIWLVYMAGHAGWSSPFRFADA